MSFFFLYINIRKSRIRTSKSVYITNLKLTSTHFHWNIITRQEVLTRWTETVIFAVKAIAIIITITTHCRLFWTYGKINDFQLKGQKFKLTENPRKKMSPPPLSLSILLSHSSPFSLFLPLFLSILSIYPWWSSRANKWMGPDRIFKRLSGETENPHIRLMYKTYPSL